MNSYQIALAIVTAEFAATAAYSAANVKGSDGTGWGCLSIIAFLSISGAGGTAAAMGAFG